MRATTLLARILCLKQTRVRGFEFVSGGLVVRVAPRTRVPRCSGCLCRVRRVYDSRPRRWRHLDLAGMAMWLAYNLRRLDCPRCGVLVELVPWAEPWVWFTHEFEEMVAYLAQRTDKTTIVTMLRVAWATVGAIIERVVARLGGRDRLEGLTHIGIDELSYRRHHEYVTVVVDHVRGVVVWVHPGKNAETLNHFFEALGTERAGKLEAVTIDMSKAYIQVVGTASPQARIVFDRFHVQRLTHEALDEVRREQVREIAGTEEAQAIKHTRFALQKNPWNLSELETERLVEVQRTNRPLYRAYLLKETLCAILDRRQVHVARQKLLEWIRWAARSRLLPFQKLARTIRKYAEGILAYVASRLSNGRSEGLNGKIRTITRRAYGFHNVHSLIALIFLCCSNIRLDPVRTYPVLPLNLSESQNFFKYLREEYALDVLVDYAVDPADPERDVPNPRRKQLNAELRKAYAEANQLAAEYGAEAFDNPESLRRTMRGFKIANAPLGRRLAELIDRICKLDKRRASVPARVPVQQLTEGEVIKLAVERKHLTNLLKMVAYQAESDLVRLVTPHYRRAEDEGRTLIHSALATAGDIEVVNGELQVHLERLSSPHRTHALVALCEHLNETKTKFPGSKLRLRFDVKPPPGPSLAFPGPRPDGAVEGLQPDNSAGG